MTKNRERVVVAMSGGVDSSMAVFGKADHIGIAVSNLVQY